MLREFSEQQSHWAYIPRWIEGVQTVLTDVGTSIAPAPPIANTYSCFDTAKAENNMI